MKITFIGYLSNIVLITFVIFYTYWVFFLLVSYKVLFLLSGLLYIFLHIRVIISFLGFIFNLQ